MHRNILSRNNSKGVSALGAGLLIVVLVAVVLGVFFFASGGIQTGKDGKAPSKLAVKTTEAAKLAGVSEPADGKVIPRIDYEFDGIAGNPAEQDAEGDLDIDVFNFETVNGIYTKNAELKSKNLADCTLADGSPTIPAVFDGTSLQIDLVNNNYCQVNIYKFWRDTTFSGGNSETTDFQLVLGAAIVADLDDINGAGTTQMTLGDPKKIYLVTVTEGATTDDEDVVPHAFLIGSTLTTSLSTQEFANGNINIRFIDKYQSDAGQASKTRLYGTCQDDTSSRLVTNLDSSLNGAIHSSLTTADTIKLDCEIDLEVTQDGYTLTIMNPLASAATEKAYAIVYPYGETDSAGSEQVPYGVGNLTGDIAFSSGDVNTKQIFYEGMSFCGETITENSASDAVRRGGENLYEPKCFRDSATLLKGVWGIHNNKAVLKMPMTILEVPVDDDASASGTDERWSGVEHLANITLITLESATDRINVNLTG